MKILGRLFRSTTSAGLLVLAACGGGGGGSGVAGTTSVSQTPTAVPVGPAAPATLGPNTALLATGTTPNIVPPLSAAIAGTVFPLRDTALSFGPGTVSAATAVNNGGATMTFTGTQVGSRAVFELKVPALGIDATLPVDGTTVTSGNFSVGGSAFPTPLSYTLLTNWTAAGSTGPSYVGFGVTGYQTPVSGVPTSGQANYRSSPGTVGATYSDPSSSSPFVGQLAGKASLGIDFSSGVVTGSLTEMRLLTQSTVPLPNWNDVSLAGTLSGATVSGTTTAGSAPTGGNVIAPLGPSGSLVFATGSTGSFNGALFGPNGQEVGIVWSLYDGSGSGKVAVGAFSAGKQ